MTTAQRKGITADWKGREGMDKLSAIKVRYESLWIKSSDIEWMIKEIETLRLDNTYLQQRLKREVEK